MRQKAIRSCSTAVQLRDEGFLAREPNNLWFELKRPVRRTEPLSVSCEERKRCDVDAYEQEEVPFPVHSSRAALG